jgi:hypothetical protein
VTTVEAETEVNLGGRPSKDSVKQRLLTRLRESGRRGFVVKEILTDGVLDSSEARTSEAPIHSVLLNEDEVRVLAELVDEGTAEIYDAEKHLSLGRGTKNRSVLRARLWSAETESGYGFQAGPSLAVEDHVGMTVKQ